jgi:hypothetical protein
MGYPSLEHFCPCIKFNITGTVRDLVQYVRSDTYLFFPYFSPIKKLNLYPRPSLTTHHDILLQISVPNLSKSEESSEETIGTFKAEKRDELLVLLIYIKLIYHQTIYRY